jgi:hypothetical protein
MTANTLYWIAIVCGGNATAPVLHAVAAASAWPILGRDSPSATTGFGVGWYKSSTSCCSAMPSPFPTTPTPQHALNPAVYVRFAS